MIDKKFLIAQHEGFNLQCTELWLRELGQHETSTLTVAILILNRPPRTWFDYVPSEQQTSFDDEKRLICGEGLRVNQPRAELHVPADPELTSLRSQMRVVLNAIRVASRTVDVAITREDVAKMSVCGRTLGPFAH